MIKSKKNILLVDDDEDQLTVLGILLEHQDYEVTTARGLKIALEKYYTETPEMIVADINMPGGGGKALLEHIRNHNTAIPVIMITAGDPCRREEMLEAGATAFCQKYDHERELLQRLNVAARAIISH